MNDIELIQLTKTYLGAEEPAVKRLSLAIEKGSIVTILGPSGCGKTTTLRLIAGFERPDSGSIILAGWPVCHGKTWVPPEKRNVGMVFQDYALFPHLNVTDNVSFGYKNKDKPTRVKEVMDLVNLVGYEKRYPHELSGGQQQRVALARALVRKPVVVLLDEPFSNLEPDLRMQMRLEVRRIIKESGATAVFVSHDQKDAFAISDLIVVMKDGLVIQAGTPREIYQYPENRFVATFVGQTNILHGVICPDGQSVLTKIGLVPCHHTHGLAAGEKVCLSIRPESLEKDDAGVVKGYISETVYTGDKIDAVIDVHLRDGETQRLRVHIHPEEEVSPGEIVSFTVLPDFVAVVRNGE